MEHVVRVYSRKKSILLVVYDEQLGRWRAQRYIRCFCGHYYWDPESAEQERVANIAAAHQAGLSVRQIAAAVRLSPARVHQLLHATVSSAAVRATTMRWDSSTTHADAGSRVPFGSIAALLRECTEWLDRLDREEFVAVNLREATDP